MIFAVILTSMYLYYIASAGLTPAQQRLTPAQRSVCEPFPDDTIYSCNSIINGLWNQECVNIQLNINQDNSGVSIQIIGSISEPILKFETLSGQLITFSDYDKDNALAYFATHHLWHSE